MTWDVVVIAHGLQICRLFALIDMIRAADNEVGLLVVWDLLDVVGVGHCSMVANLLEFSFFYCSSLGWKSLLLARWDIMTKLNGGNLALNFMQVFCRSTHDWLLTAYMSVSNWGMCYHTWCQICVETCRHTSCVQNFFVFL